MACNPGEPCYGNNNPVVYKTYPKGCIPTNNNDCLSTNLVCYTGPSLANIGILGGDTVSVSLQKINQSITGSIYGNGVVGQFAVFATPSSLTSVSGLTWTSGELTVNGQLKIQTINSSVTDVDKFLVSDGGKIEYRTGSEVLSDIGGEPFIVSGNVLQYWRGDKTWQTLDTLAVPENTNLYFTTARARNSISLTNVGTSGASTYDVLTGIINVPNYGLGSVPIRKRFIVGDVGYPADGATTWTDSDFNGSTLWLYRNKILQDWVDPGDGDSYYTLTGSTITFNPALSASEKINLLIF